MTWTVRAGRAATTRYKAFPSSPPGRPQPGKPGFPPQDFGPDPNDPRPKGSPKERGGWRVTNSAFTEQHPEHAKRLEEDADKVWRFPDAHAEIFHADGSWTNFTPKKDGSLKFDQHYDPQDYVKEQQAKLDEADRTAKAEEQRKRDNEKAKVPKEKVNYRKAANPRERCGTCANYLNPGKCALVRGAIEPGSLCDKWEAKEKKWVVRPGFRVQVKYSDDQPRDDHGRWTSGGSDSVSGDMHALREPGGSRFSGGGGREATTVKPPSGWKKASKNGLAQWINENGAKAGIGEPAAKVLAAMALDRHDVYLNGDSKVEFDKSVHVSADKQAEVMKVLSSLQEKYPGARTVSVIPKAEMTMITHNQTALGATQVGGTHILLAPDAVRPSHDTQFHTDNAHGWSEPSGAKADVTTYTLTHEMGHTLDSSFRKWSTQGFLDSTEPGSTYGRTDSGEAFAESFAEWTLSGGNTDDELANDLAHTENWK